MSASPKITRRPPMTYIQLLIHIDLVQTFITLYNLSEIIHAPMFLIH